MNGVNPNLVIDAILGRRDRLDAGKPREDGRKLGLVIEGGGMRGVCSAAGAVALAQLGCSSVFDYVLVTSAAVMNASYLISDQPFLGYSVYVQDCCSSRFFSPWRFWKMLDVDYVVDDVVSKKKPVDVSAIRQSPTTLIVALMDATTGEARYVDATRSYESMKSVYRAAMAIPVLYNRTVQVEGRECIDGGLAAPFPIQKAIDIGCTDILCLLTRPEGYKEPQGSCWSRLAFSILAARGNRGLQATYDRRRSIAARYRRLAAGGLARGATSPNIASVCTEGEELAVERTTVDVDLLLTASGSYWSRVLRLFGEEKGEFVDHVKTNIPSLEFTEASTAQQGCE